MIPVVKQGILVDQATAIQDGRARLKMSQEHLASAAGISARTVVRAESGFRVSGESLRGICAVLGLDSASLAPVEGSTDAGAPRMTFRQVVRIRARPTRNPRPTHSAQE